MNQPAKQEAIFGISVIGIKKLLKQAISEAIGAALAVRIQHRKEEVKNPFSQTEVRLYAYRDLRDNIEQYRLDIEDLKRENPGKSKSLVFGHGGDGVRLSDEEIQQGRIEIIQNKVARDTVEINEIDRALERINTDQYFPIIGMKYFEGKSDDEIAETIPCNPRTVRRHKNRLVKRIAIKLYGADAVKAVNIDRNK